MNNHSLKPIDVIELLHWYNGLPDSAGVCMIDRHADLCTVHCVTYACTVTALLQHNVGMQHLHPPVRIVTVDNLTTHIETHCLEHLTSL